MKAVPGLCQYLAGVRVSSIFYNRYLNVLVIKSRKGLPFVAFPVHFMRARLER